VTDTKTTGKRRPPRRVAETARAAGTRTPVCTVAFCPICLAVTAAQGSAPDAVEHLMNAAREFLLAARAVIDARADDLQRSKERGSRRLEKIDIT
jgi:hypothetical protein